MKLVLFLTFLCYILDSVYTQAIPLSITLARGNSDAVNTNQINYYRVQPCYDYGNLNTAVLSIALPTNVDWNTSMSYVVMELSTSSTKFDQSTVFATNYIWGNTRSAFAQIVWDWPQYLDANGNFYIRVTAPVRAVAYSFELEFVSNEAFTSGKYNSYVFPQSSVPSNAVFNQLMQYVALTEPDMVVNFAVKTYLVQFCIKDLPPPCNQDDFTLIVTAESTPNKPLSLFNLYVCQSYPCNYDTRPSVVDQISTSLVQVEVTNAALPDMSNGVYISVAGFGAELDGKNEYYLSIRIY